MELASFFREIPTLPNASTAHWGKSPFGNIVEKKFCTKSGKRFSMMLFRMPLIRVNCNTDSTNVSQWNNETGFQAAKSGPCELQCCRRCRGQNPPPRQSTTSLVWFEEPSVAFFTRVTLWVHFRPRGLHANKAYLFPRFCGIFFFLRVFERNNKQPLPSVLCSIFPRARSGIYLVVHIVVCQINGSYRLGHREAQVRPAAPNCASGTLAVLIKYSVVHGKLFVF